MARIRNIKPEFFTSEAVSELPLRARLTWIGLWTHCDNHGRARDNVKIIKGAVWPLDNVSLKEIEDDLVTLAACGRIVRYVVRGKRYLVVTNWGEHQYGAFKGDSKYPAPTADAGSKDPAPTAVAVANGSSGTVPVDNSATVARTTAPPAGQQKSRQDLDESRPDQDFSTGIQGSGVRGQGGGTRETATPTAPRKPRCAQHAGLPDDEPGPNCLACRKVRLVVERQAADDHLDERLTIRGCGLCDGDGYRLVPGRRMVQTPYVRCDHRPQRVST
jgi:hypothetical protein